MSALFEISAFVLCAPFASSVCIFTYSYSLLFFVPVCVCVCRFLSERCPCT